LPGTGVPVGTLDSEAGDGALGVPTRVGTVLADDVAADAAGITELAALVLASWANAAGRSVAARRSLESIVSS
jgi:hypothetical protein